MWSKVKSYLAKARLSSKLKGNIGNGENDLNVNEEYMEAFRSKSYTDIWSKINDQIRKTNEERHSLSPIPSYLNIPDNLLEPSQEDIAGLIDGSSRRHALLLDYFEGSLEACKICGFLLHCIDQTRLNYGIIQGVIKLTQRAAAGDYSKEQYRFVYAQLSSFVGLENPLSGSNPEQFRRIHDLYRSLLEQLTRTRKQILQRVKFIGFWKKTLGISLVIACGALAIAAIVLTTCTFFGLLAMPTVICSQTLFLKSKLRSVGSRHRRRYLARLAAQLDAAARGAYILDRDFDTMSRLVTRLHDEIEHSKAVIRICLRNGKLNLLEEVVKELKNNEGSFLEQLEELEEHVYLCFLTINRARRLVIKEIEVDQQVSS